MRLGRDVEGAEQHAGTGTGGAGLRIDLDASHGAQIDNEARIAGRGARNAVAATANGEREPCLGPEQDGGAYVLG